MNGSGERFHERKETEGARYSKAEFADCPLMASLGLLGKKTRMMYELLDDDGLRLLTRDFYHKITP